MVVERAVGVSETTRGLCVGVDWMLPKLLMFEIADLHTAKGHFTLPGAFSIPVQASSRGSRFLGVQVHVESSAVLSASPFAQSMQDHGADDIHANASDLGLVWGVYPLCYVFFDGSRDRYRLPRRRHVIICLRF